MTPLEQGSLINVVTDEHGNTIAIPDLLDIRQDVGRLQEALYRLASVNGHLRFHQERVKAYVEQTDQVAKEIQLSLNSLKSRLSTGLAHPAGNPGAQSATGLSPQVSLCDTFSHKDARPAQSSTHEDSSESLPTPSPPMPPIRAATPEDFYMDDEFDELARSVELTPGGGHVKLPDVKPEYNETDTSYVLGSVVKNIGEA